MLEASVASSKQARLWWYEPKSRESLIAGLEAGINVFVFRDEYIDKVHEWSSLARFNAVIVEQDGRFSCNFDNVNGRFFPCSSAEDMDYMITQANEQGAINQVFVMDRRDGWQVIPVENLVAAKQQKECNARFAVVVQRCEDAETMLNLLDMGVDGVILKSDEAAEIRRFGMLKVETEKSEQLRLTGAIATAIVRDIRSVGSGDRVCVDCSSNMTEDEALLCGNSSQTMFFIMSEAKESEYVKSRPFRCNAGPVHAYVLCPGGRTKYLAELEAGDEVLSIRVSPDGTSVRNLVVGRTKLETRPLLLLTAQLEQNGKRCSVLLQNAETVRVASITEDNAVSGKSIVELKRGDRVLVRVDDSARHLGMPIVEHILEK